MFELADKYYITEAKACRMLVEISKRYRKPGLGSNVPVIRDIAARVFAGGGTPGLLRGVKQMLLP